MPENMQYDSSHKTEFANAPHLPGRAGAIRRALHGIADEAERLVHDVAPRYLADVSSMLDNCPIDGHGLAYRVQEERLRQRTGSGAPPQT